MLHTIRRQLALLVAGTVLLRVPAYLADRHLTFDDGVFGASAVAMRHGGRPFADVFSSQGPLFLPLVWFGDLLGLRTMNSPRVIAVLSGVVLVLAVHAAGRIVSDRAGALLAAILTSTSIGVLGVTAPIAADGPAMAAGAIAVLLALRWRDGEPTAGKAVALGVAVSVALSVKSLLLPTALPAALVLVAWRRASLLAVAAGTAAALHLLIGLPWGWADVWDQSYSYHLEVAGERTPLSNLGKTASTLGDRELPLIVLSVLAGLTAWRRRSLRLGWTTPDALLLVWLAGTVLVLANEHPMWRPHVAHLVPPAALLVARHRPSWRAIAIAAVVVAPYHVVHAWEWLAPTPYRGATAAVVGELRALPEGAFAISDDPGLVWRAGRRTTDDLVDASILRIETERVTAETVAEAAADPRVCAVAVRSRVRWGSFEDLPDLLVEVGYEIARQDGRRVLWIRTECDPP